MRLLEGLHWAVNEGLESARLEERPEQVDWKEEAAPSAQVDGGSPSRQEAQLLCKQLSGFEVGTQKASRHLKCSQA